MSRELIIGNEELYKNIQRGMTEQVKHMKVTSQKLVSGQPLDALQPLNEQESRWLGWYNNFC
jgi:hypothetical protein